MLQNRRETMKCVQYESAGMESSTDSEVSLLKASVPKQQTPVKAPHPAVFSSSWVHNKENNTNKDHDRVLEECLEDSGYLSLQNSHIEPHGDEVDAGYLGKLSSPSKCRGGHQFKPPVSSAVSTPVDHFKRTLSSTPASDRCGPNLPILRFQKAVEKELLKSYKKNQTYDFSIIPKLAEGYPLDRVIGRKMGLEHVDVLASLLSRNMKILLTNILALLGDMDLISVKKVSKTWRKIICEDAAAIIRCREAEQNLRESTNSLSLKACGLTRDVATSRGALSCMQNLATSNSLSSQSHKTPRAAPIHQKCSVPNTPHTRFDEFVQAASALKNHESLRKCQRCGSPAKHLSESQRATCTRASCQYDFCTRCQETFHGSVPCRTVQPRSGSFPVFTKSSRNKRSLRRL